MIKKIEGFLEVLPKMTKEEAESINEILDWDNEMKVAFKLAKRIFEDESDDKKEILPEEAP
jgi:hypothetical protein